MSVTPETKRCPRCGITKSRQDFYKKSSKKDGLQPQCKRCVIEQVQAWKAANPEKVRQMTRRRRLERDFGITEDHYAALLAAQDGACATCGKKCPSGNRLAVDHCHKTGEVRGLLCVQCNTALGLVGDSPELLARLIEYLGRGGAHVRPALVPAARNEAVIHPDAACSTRSVEGISVL